MTTGGRAQLRVALSVLIDAQARRLLPEKQALDAALDVILRVAQPCAASAVNKLAVCVAVGSDHLAELVRRDRDRQRSRYAEQEHRRVTLEAGLAA